MNPDEAPVLDALADYHRVDRLGFTPPAHRQGRGRGVYPRVADVLGGALKMDVLSTAGLDDRKSSNGYAAIDGWRRQTVQHGTQLIGDALALTERTRQAIERIPGLHVLRDELVAEEASHDYDPMHVLIDVKELGVSGYQVADWLRSEHRLDVGINDHRRVEATLSIAEDEGTTGRLLEALEQLPEAAETMPEPAEVALPNVRDLEPVIAALPRDAFFGPIETVPVAEAVGRVARPDDHP